MHEKTARIRNQKLKLSRAEVIERFKKVKEFGVNPKLTRNCEHFFFRNKPDTLQKLTTFAIEDS